MIFSSCRLQISVGWETIDIVTLAVGFESFALNVISIGVFVALFAWARTKWADVGMFTAIVFAVGVGLPGYSIQSAGLRTFFSLIGTLWALLGEFIEHKNL